MSAAFGLYVLLIGLSALSLVADTLLLHGILGAYTALLVFLIAFSMPSGESQFVATFIRRAAIAAVVPALWMLVQVLPLPFQALQHPIWTSAQAALGPIWGSISISPGATLVALARYVVAFGLFFVASAVSVDRQRAEVLLLWLACITTVLAAALIVHDLSGFLLFGEIGGSGPRIAAVASASLGTVLTLATAVFAIERYETRHNRAEFGRTTFVAILVTAFGAFLVCWIAVLFFAPRPAIFAASTGVGTLVVVVGFRRLGLSPVFGLILAVAAVGVPLSIIARDLVVVAPDLSLRFAVTAKPILDVAQRIVSDTGWLGSGAGSFSAMLPIYDDTGAATVARVAPTTAADVLTGFGAPAFWIAVIGTLAGILSLLRGALRRGRDSFFSAAGASCGIVLLIQAFTDASLNESVVLVIATAVLGLGLAQRVSRSSR